jgi:hypothetical protein
MVQADAPLDHMARRVLTESDPTGVPYNMHTWTGGQRPACHRNENINRQYLQIAK